LVSSWQITYVRQINILAYMLKNHRCRLQERRINVHVSSERLKNEDAGHERVLHVALAKQTTTFAIWERLLEAWLALIIGCKLSKPIRLHGS